LPDLPPLLHNAGMPAARRRFVLRALVAAAVALACCCLLLGTELPSAAALTAEGNGNQMFASALTFQIEPREEQCFYEDLTRDKQFRLEFEVVRGGLLDIKLRISDPNGGAVVDKIAYFNKEDDALNEAEGRVSFVASSTGRYGICFDNTMSRWTAKVVSFFVLNDAASSASSGAAAGKDSVAKLQDLGPTVDAVIKIADELDAIEGIQHHMRVREQQHRDSTLATNAHVQWFALVEALLLIGLTAFQIQYIRHWFAETSARGRV